MPKNVSLYKPDGTASVFIDVIHFYVDDNGILVIQPNEEDIPTFGKYVRSSLPFIINEPDESLA